MTDFMKLFEEFGAMKDQDPASLEVQDQVKKLLSSFFRRSRFIVAGKWTTNSVRKGPLML